MKKRLLFIVICLTIFCTIFFLLFYKNHYKKMNYGNNISNKNLDEIEKYILDINQYEAIIEVEINSNKNINKYVIKQNVANNECKQEILDPDNIKGIETLYKDGKLIINNSRLNLKKIYNNYPYITDNMLFLNDFLSKYKELKNENMTNIEATEESIVLEVLDKNGKKEVLYVDKNNVKPKQLILKDVNEKTLIYILYKEINVNNNK